MYKIFQTILISITITVFCLYLYAINLSSISTKENVTVKIVGAEWSGSGFILEDGIIVTAAHVMQDVVDARVVFSDGTEVVLDPNTYMLDKVWDVAIAKIHNYTGPCAILGASSTIILGSDIELVGYPLGETLWHSFGRVARLEKAGRLSLDIDGVPGDSGCPCFNEGLVVGILTSGYNSTQMCFAVDISVIINMIDRYKILKD